MKWNENLTSVFYTFNKKYGRLRISIITAQELSYDIFKLNYHEQVSWFSRITFSGKRCSFWLQTTSISVRLWHYLSTYSSILRSTTRAAQRSSPAHNKLYCRWISYITSWIRAKRVVSGRVHRVRLEVDKTAKQRVPSICNILRIARIRHIYFTTIS